MIKIKSINKFFIAFSCLILLISTRGFFLINTSHKIEQASPVFATSYFWKIRKQ